MDKKSSRIKRSLRARSRIRLQAINRLTIHRTPQHIYAQVISVDGEKTVVSVSTTQAGVKSAVKNTGNVDAAKEVGTLIAKKALEVGIKEVAFDRSGFKYHGRVKALADAAREAGLKF